MNTTLLLVTALMFLALLAMLYRMYQKMQDGRGQPVENTLYELNEKLRSEIREIREKVQHLNEENRKEIQGRLDGIAKGISSFQQNTSDTLQKQFGQSQRIIAEVTEKLSKIDSTNKQVLGFAEQMKSLERILQNPKQRGVLGEYFLEALLGNVLQPNQYKMQYAFPNGDIVDAAIFYRDMIIPIDAKFSLENYNKLVQTDEPEVRQRLEKVFKSDVKKRIDETSKYVMPHEGTTDFAFMFIPAEGIYYNLLIYNVGAVEVNTKDLVEYAFSKHVIIVSPTSFYAYLETVLQGLKALKIEDSVKEIQKRIEDLGRHLRSYEGNMLKLGKHLGTTVSAYNSASGEFRKIDKDIYKITEGSAGGEFEANLLDKPQQPDE